MGEEEAEEDDEPVAAAEAEAELIMPTTELTPPMNSFNGLELVVLWPNTVEAVVKARKADENLVCHMLLRDKRQFEGRSRGSQSRNSQVPIPILMLLISPFGSRGVGRMTSVHRIARLAGVKSEECKYGRGDLAEVNSRVE